ncbi:MAG: Ig-like domain-containing protein, partial [Chloroflexota bacterium]|nr:Ig-like domain-containing protein [Chloroflexota bacterium]
VPANYNLVITNINNSNAGDIYYTTDRSDPRAVGGGINGTALNGADSAQTLITQVTNVKARVKNGDDWSPLIDYMFYPPQPFAQLVVNEIHYHPTAPLGVDGDDYEFIELYNQGPTPLRLDNVSFTRGVSYRFPVGTVLNPNQYLVLASDPVGFSTRYPSVTAFGDMRGNLSNRGEGIELRDAVGNVIDLFDYTDLPPWPLAADGTGPSLELSNPAWDNALAANWKAATLAHGTPGAQNSTFMAGVAPTVVLTSPANNTITQGGIPVVINAVAGDSDGTVTQVAFFVNNVPVAGCVDVSEPYQCTWTPFVAGAYSLTAQATDNHGANTTSAAVNVQVNTTVNQPPTVAIVSPADGATALTGAAVTIVATGNDADGMVTQMAFFINGAPIAGCVDMTDPYECTWTPTTAGAYSLTAQATDNGAATATSAAVNVAVNQPPTVAINSPADGATSLTGSGVTIVATAVDTNGSVTQVAFFANGAPISGCVDMTVAYECAWTPATAGAYSLTAQATDNGAATTTSAAINVTVNDPPLNQPPTAVINSPANGASFGAGSMVTVQASATDGDGSVSKVAFFANGVLIAGCEDSTEPYECTYAPPAGTHLLVAQATDNKGAAGSSAAITIIVTATDPAVNQPPTAVINSPANATSFGAGSLVTIQASATDADGTITQVAFFANGVLIAGCEDSTAPYECTYTPSVGTHLLVAQATDNKGAVSENVVGTTGVNIIITGNAPPNQLPTVSITSPAANINTKSGQSLLIQATAADADGSVAKVIFFVDNERIAGCEDSAAPYECTFLTPATAGVYSLTAQAMDNKGAVSLSSAVLLTVEKGADSSPKQIYLPLIDR